jgi:hypothetical protein
MRLYRKAPIVAAMLLGLAVVPCAFARGGHAGGHSGSHAAASGNHGGHLGPRFHSGMFVGAALFTPFYFYPALPPYYPVPQLVPVPGQSQYWYYCASSQTYYPYVLDCPEGWQQVVPQPPS